MNSRLLFAAGRGARIEYNPVDDNDPVWIEPQYVDLHDLEAPDYRTHPDDAHLEYGPISTALQVFAAGNTRRPKDDSFWRIARDYYIHAAGAQFYDLDDNSRAVFLLILAEVLADEGL